MRRTVHGVRLLLAVALLLVVAPAAAADGNSRRYVSPDARLVAVLEGGAGTAPRVFVAPVSGDSRRLLAEHPEALNTTGITHFAWSPDSRYIAYAVGLDGRLVVIEVESGAIVAVDGATVWSGLEWTHDSRAIVHADKAGALRLQRLGGGSVVVADLAGAELHPAISPEGGRVAFVNQTTRALYVVPVAGGEPRQLGARLYGPGRPRWAPDGRRIVLHDLTGYEDLNVKLPRAIFSVVVVDVGTARRARVRDGYSDPSWIGNAFIRAYSDLERAYLTMNADGSCPLAAEPTPGTLRRECVELDVDVPKVTLRRGRPSTIRLRVTNNGTAAAQSVSVGVVRSGAIARFRVGGAKCVSSARIECSLGRLSPGETRTLRIRVVATGRTIGVGAEAGAGVVLADPAGAVAGRLLRVAR